MKLNSFSLILVKAVKQINAGEVSLQSVLAHLEYNISFMSVSNGGRLVG
ncbi:unnamed protein product [Tenebrio molitor]|nr:unnamed protein product [Tenebrio molitor]